jgi:LPXTG-motif cell wall-anchored protein
LPKKSLLGGEVLKILKYLSNYLMIFVLVIAQLAFVMPNTAQANNQSASLSINGKDGEILAETEFTFVEGDTVYDVLEEVSQANNILVEYEEDPTFGKYILSINGEIAESPNYWSFLVNGEYAQTGISTFKVSEGDHLEFNFVKGKPSASLKIIGENDEEILDIPWYEMPEEITALELLQTITTEQNIELTITDSDYGPMITSINNLAMEGNSYWGFYLNQQYATEGAATYIVKNLDQIVFKYETYVPPTGEDNDEEDGNNLAMVDIESINQSVESAITFLSSNQLDVWSVISLVKNGKSLPKSYLDTIRKSVLDQQGKFRKITDTEKYVLAILAYGEDPTNVEGFNLLEKIYNGDVTKQGANGVAFGLLALNAANVSIPDDALWTEQKLIHKLIQSQNKDGGWPLFFDSASEIDITAMIMTALAPYQADNTSVKEAIQSAKNYLKGKIESGNLDNSNSTAQVIIALSSLGVNPASFVENTNILSYLIGFQNVDGGFSYIPEESSDSKATSDALLALTAYKISLNDQYVYSFENDNPIIIDNSTEINDQENELPNTASNIYNLMIVGLVLILIAFLSSRFNINRKKI